MLKQKEIDSVVARIKVLVNELGNDNAILGKVKMLYGWLNNQPDRTTLGILTLEIERIEKLISESGHVS